MYREYSKTSSKQDMSCTPTHPFDTSKIKWVELHAKAANIISIINDLECIHPLNHIGTVTEDGFTNTVSQHGMLQKLQHCVVLVCKSVIPIFAITIRKTIQIHIMSMVITLSCIHVLCQQWRNKDVQSTIQFYLVFRVGWLKHDDAAALVLIQQPPEVDHGVGQR